MADINMRQWKNVELTVEDAEKFRIFLHSENIKFESSGCFNMVHFECFVNGYETHKINEFLRDL